MLVNYYQKLNFGFDLKIDNLLTCASNKISFPISLFSLKNKFALPILTFEGFKTTTNLPLLFNWSKRAFGFSSNAPPIKLRTQRL